MGGESGEEAAGVGVAETAAGESGGGLEGLEAEAGEEERVFREGKGAEDFGGEGVPVFGDGADEVSVGVGVGVELGGGFIEGAFEDGGVAVVERVGEIDFGVDPLEAVRFEGKGAEIGGIGAERVDGGADVVAETGFGEFEGAHAAADGFFGFHDFDGESVALEQDRGGESVGAGADHDGVVFGGCHGAIVAKKRGVGKAGRRVWLEALSARAASLGS